VAEASLGIRISAGRVEGADGAVEHVALSDRVGLTPEATEALADLVLLLRGPAAPGRLAGELVPGSRGVYHLVLRAADPCSGAAGGAGGRS
jgi:hypothetical protein